ncbi:hypothetical protein NY2A_b605R [Paramecium bursaria Chlorella virus NY2A]|uniref:Uncharacterized protein b605R n=1 Tax=Paramecium bursaria Chlorella virus NY2A TaxID=46021 RepID=A7IXD0_PBCVN|nr:hypothetical protein NY2A_b605R [Paramecium bursaria Chlorella virus NY2A]YP_001498631.1 hypothetical protein AR158_c550R [Paramecium bursaria Chlorella virus AR158]ABT15004.1 hypothetical protein NY2A_b605R [Paramecium bursaria Chlorella virus NY2A]ABU44095.1 hypothetical protein AR158_c550R [Paramecium bursaria Chlorella virus AR158]
MINLSIWYDDISDNSIIYNILSNSVNTKTPKTYFIIRFPPAISSLRSSFMEKTKSFMFFKLAGVVRKSPAISLTISIAGTSTISSIMSSYFFMYFVRLKSLS